MGYPVGIHSLNVSIFKIILVSNNTFVLNSDTYKIVNCAMILYILNSFGNACVCDSA